MVLIKYKGDESKIFEVDLNSWTFSKSSIEDPTNSEVARKAFLVESQEGFFVAIATIEGPALLHKGHQCLLSDPSWTIRVEKGDVYNVVHFDGLHGETFSFNHPRYIPAAWDIWDDEDTNDFFLCVENMKNKKQGAFESFTLKK
jgi:hypothetical protein